MEANSEEEEEEAGESIIGEALCCGVERNRYEFGKRGGKEGKRE